MRLLRSFGFLLLLAGLTALAAPSEALRAQAKKEKKEDKSKDKKEDKGKDKTRFADVGNLNAEVTVLRVLGSLQATPKQLKTLAKYAKETMQSAPPKKEVKVSEKYRKALRALREALLSGDEDTIEEASKALEDIRDGGEEPEFEDIEVTDKAREVAPEVLRLFSARQVALYLGDLDSFPDPAEQLRDALAESQKKKGREWTTYRDDVAYQVGWLLGGLNSEKEQAARKAATALLNKAAKMDEEEFNKNRAELEKSIKTIIGKTGPTTVIRNFMERLLAETLSNHRLIAAINAKQAALKAKENEEKPKDNKKDQ
jgi:hypothetical protein